MKKKAGVNSKQWEATRTCSSTVGAHTNLKLPMICRLALPLSLFTVHFEVHSIEGRVHACFMIQHGLNSLRCSIAQRVHAAAKPHLHFPTSRRHALGHTGRLPLPSRHASTAALQKKSAASKSDLLVSATIRERLVTIADTLSDVENHGDWKGMEDEIATLEQKLQVSSNSHSALNH